MRSQRVCRGLGRATTVSHIDLSLADALHCRDYRHARCSES